jgi:integrase
MKPVRLAPRKTAIGWQLNIPASLSTTGKRQRQYFKTKDAAEGVAAPLREKYRQGDAAASILPRVEGDAAGKALALLKKRDLSPLLLIEAVEQYLERRDEAAKSVTFKTACERFISRRKAEKRTSKHLDDYTRLTKRFPEFAEKLLCDIDKECVESTLEGLPSSSFNLALREIRAVFNHGIRENWCSENPALKVETLDEDASQVEILNAKQVRRLFTAAIRLRPELVPLLAIETFAGVRPVEASKVTWEDLDREDARNQVLHVRSEVAKTRKERFIVLHPQCAAWLDWHRERGGAIEGFLCPIRGEENPRKSKRKKFGREGAEISTALRDALREIRERAKITPWPQDCLRHTFASVAIKSGWRDKGGTCSDLGHTIESTFEKHYRRDMRKSAAEAILKVAPPRRIKGA